MKKVGLTGGIGSGKSVVAKIFEQLGVPVYYADFWSKELMNTDENVKQKIKERLGKDVYDSEGKADRKKIAELVFDNKEKLNSLNAILHPAVWQHGENWMKQHTGKPYVIKEAAILFESGSNVGSDKIITVSAPKNLRIERVMLRDTISKKEVEARMKNQWSDEEKIRRSDFVIVNDDKELLIPQVLKIHQALTGR